MRKALPITLIFLLLTLSMTPFATAQQENIINNATNETLYVISSTNFGAEGDIPAGYRTSGWKAIAAGGERSFWAYDPHKIHFQIWKAGEPVKPDSATQTFAFWINRDANFDIVTRQEINADITRQQLLYSSGGTTPLTHHDGFIRYDNNSNITVTNAWVPVSQGNTPVDTTEGNTPVNIPDPALRADIEETLNKNPGDTITEAEMLTLTDYFLYDDSIADLTGLETAKNLQFLAIYGNSISNISALANLTNLTTLNITDNNISDISALANLTNLTTLRLPNTNISDISALANLTNLTGLRLKGNNISDISALANLTNLEWLDLGGNNISDISPLADLTNLGSLHLNDNNISDISPLSSLTNLEDLYLHNNNISDFSPIAGLIPNLFVYSNQNQEAVDPPPTGDPAVPPPTVDPNTLVNIPDPELRRIIALDLLKENENDPISQEEMLTLTSLSISLSSIADLTGLEFATNLTSLTLSSNAISDISPLRDLVNLEFLDLFENNISDISPLKDLVNLEFLSLQDNAISDISPLTHLVNLIDLDLENNAISDVSPLRNLVNLGYLHLYGNPVRNAHTLSRLTASIYVDDGVELPPTGVPPDYTTVVQGHTLQGHTDGVNSVAFSSGRSDARKREFGRHRSSLGRCHRRTPENPQRAYGRVLQRGP